MNAHLDSKVLATLLKLLPLGFWPIPIYPAGITITTRNGQKTTTGKEPIGRGWGAERRTESWLRGVFARFPAAGGGITFGPGRGPGRVWLADLEGDDQAVAAESLAKLLGGEEVDTMSWGSTRGGHDVFAVEGERLLDVLARAGAKEGSGMKAGVWHLSEFPGLEFRIGGYKEDGSVKQVQSVIPPTPGTDGVPRGWKGPPTVGVAWLPESAYAALERIAAEKAESTRENEHQALDPMLEWDGPQPQCKSEVAPGTSPELYAGIVLDHYLRDFAGRSEGTRHAGLLRATLRLAGLVKADWCPLEAPEVVAGLKSAARRNGMETAGRLGEIDDAWESALAMATPEIRPRGVTRGTHGTRPRARVQPHARDGGVEGNGRAEADGLVPDGVDETEGRVPPGDYGLAGEPAGRDDRPEVEVSRERHLSVDDAVVALARDEDLYRRGDSLGVVVHEVDALMKLPEGITLKNARGAARFLPLSSHGVGCRLTKNATFYSWGPPKDPKKKEPEVHDVHPPEWLIKSVFTQGHWPGIRTLQGIADCPYVREDGSIPDPGFDRSTGTLYQPSVGPLDLPDRPERNDVRDAYDHLHGLVDQFPFAEDGSFAVWLAALLTAIQRPMIRGPVPGFAFNGNRAGVGKGLLIDLIGIIVWGHPIPTRAYPADAAEAEKLKLALGLAATPVVHFDNLSEGSSYGSSVIDSCLTSITVSGRLLGLSRDSGPVPLRCLWMLSGNNISVIRDAYRRWLPCNLDSPLEEPHERKDLEVSDLREYASTHRWEYVRDAIMILKAHSIEGYRRPSGWGLLGSFEQWDRYIRGAVHYIDGNDCLKTQRKAAIDSPERTDKAALLDGWLAATGSSNGMTAQDAIDRAEKLRQPTLYMALMAMSRDGKMPTARVLGNRLRGMKGQSIDGKKFERAGENRDGAVVWKVV